MHVIGDTFTSAWQAMGRASVLLPSVAATIAAHAVFTAADVSRGFWSLPTGTMAVLAIVVALRFWIGLSVSLTALQLMRGGFQRRPTYWVGPTTAFQAAVVCAGLGLAVIAGVLFLIIPGIVAAIGWSQAAMLIVDEESEWFEAAGASWLLTSGRRISILIVWLATGALLGTAEWLVSITADVGAATGVPAAVMIALAWIASAAADVFSLSIVAAVYHELTLTPETGPATNDPDGAP